MWNPETYRDTDYGLEPDEPFEPADDVEDELVLAANEPYIQTVLGPIRPEEAGVTLVHEYLQHSGEGRDTDRLDDVQAALLDLEAYFSASGRTIVSAATSSTGRDAGKLRWLARHAPVHIVAATGHVGAAEAGRIMATRIEGDVTSGMDGTTCRAGVLTVARHDVASPPAREVIAMIADVHNAHGTPIFAESRNAATATAQVHALTARGVDPSSIVSVVGGAATDLSSARDLLEAGVFLVFGKLGHGDDTAAAETIARLVDDGFRDQILLSHGYTSKSHLTGYGGRPGLPYVVEYFAVMLLEAGLGAQDVRSVLVDNAARALSLRQRA